MNEETSNVMAFDALYTNNQIQKLKVLLPYIDPSMQKHMAIYIKYMELKYTIELFKRHPFHIRSMYREKESPEFKKICSELKPYCTESENKQLEQMASMLKTMDMYQEMSQTMSIIQEMFPNMSMETSGDSHSDGNASGGPSIESILMGMLSPEQKAMYEAFNNTLS